VIYPKLQKKLEVLKKYDYPNLRPWLSKIAKRFIQNYKKLEVLKKYDYPKLWHQTKN